MCRKRDADSCPPRSSPIRDTIALATRCSCTAAETAARNLGNGCVRRRLSAKCRCFRLSEGRRDRRADQQCGVCPGWRRRGSEHGRLAASIRNQLFRCHWRDPGGPSSDARTPEGPHSDDELDLRLCDPSNPGRLQRLETRDRSPKQCFASRTLSLRYPHHSYPARLHHDQHSEYRHSSGSTPSGKVQEWTLREDLCVLFG